MFVLLALATKRTRWRCPRSMIAGSGRLISRFSSFVNSTNSRRYYKSDMLLGRVVSKLTQLADHSLAESWDNVGLLVEPSNGKNANVNMILLTNDLTEPVVEEAVSKDVDLVISYHPPIFSAIKRLSSNNWKDRCILRCIENKIAIYSPHTCHDAVRGGVNDWLAEAFDTKRVTVIDQSMQVPDMWTHQITLVVPQSSGELLENIKRNLSASEGGESDDFAWISNGSQQEGVSCSATLFCRNSKSVLIRIETLLLQYPLVSSCVTKLDPKPIPETGMGRVCVLDKEMPLRSVVERIKKHLGVGAVQVALAAGKSLDSSVHSVALCAGSGSQVLRGVRSDVFWTGEMSHHDILDAVACGSSVVLCGHSNTERGYLERFASVLNQALEDKVKILISEQDRDPLQFL